MTFQVGDEVRLVKEFWYSGDDEDGNKYFAAVLNEAAEDPNNITAIVDIVDDQECQDHNAIAVTFQLREGGEEKLYVDRDRIAPALEPATDQEVDEAIASILKGRPA